MLVIDTDGSIEQVDHLKSAFEGAPETGLNVQTDTLDTVLTHPAIVARQRGIAALCPTCRACPVHRVCGAGIYSHRYRPETGFLNPSVYCTDLCKLVDHIRDQVDADSAGISRHVVRFVADGGDLYALKSTSERLARREYRLLRALADARLVSVPPQADGYRRFVPARRCVGIGEV